MTPIASVLFQLFTAFFRIGLFSFGGGYAIIPLLQHEAVSRSWLTAAEFTDIVAVSQVTPGPIAVNMATFVGYRQCGVAGALIATFGVCLPSVVLVLIAVAFIARVNKSKTLKSAFFGLRPATTGLIAASTFVLAWREIFPGAEVLDFSAAVAGVSVFSIVIMVIAFACMYKFKLSPILVIVGAAAAGMVWG